MKALEKIMIVGGVAVMMFGNSISHGASLNVSIASDANKTETTLTGDVADLQKELENTTADLMSQLADTMQRIQKLYDGKVKALVETPLFKGVECLGYLNSSSSNVDVDAMSAEYQKAILEQYVDISADIKRLSVGLISDPQVIKNAMTSFKQKFTSELSTIETSYEADYQQLKADFETYYSVNQSLVYQVAEKIQKLDILMEKYQTLVDARNDIHESLKDRTRALDIAAAPVQSVTSILQGDLDKIISNYRIKNPEIDFAALEVKKQELMKDFAQQLDGFIGILFGSDYNVITYQNTVAKTEAFLTTYVQSKTYQCSALLSTPANWERTYLSLGDEIDALVPGLYRADEKVNNWRDDQLSKIDSALEQVFVIYYNNAMRKEKTALNKYIMQLIAEAYHASQSVASQELE